MKRRRLLIGSTAALSLPLAGCAGSDDDSDDDAEGAEDADDGTDDDPDDDADDVEENLDHARSGEGVPGRIDPLGHALADDSPFYTFGHVSPDGEWGVMGSFPTPHSDVASTLVDLSDLAAPEVSHELDTASAETRTNDVKFDALRDGIYYRSQEGDRRGIEVVDFGHEEGTPDDPAVVVEFDDVDTGVHKLSTHPEEPVIYLVDTNPQTDVAFVVVDVSTPGAPEVVERVGPTGYCHDLEYDPGRNVLHAAIIAGPDAGYVTYDADDPYDPRVLGHFEYADQPDYAELGEPGFELCHQADYDPERDLAVIGDEKQGGIPGGKHVFDLGWDEGSLEDPQPIGFTHSPDARRMEPDETYWWTTHFHDVVPMDEETLLVDGGYRQGAWVCNLTDPREPTPTERLATVEGASELPGDGRNALGLASPPFAWGAVYHEERDFVFVSDSLSGAYTAELSAEEARGAEGRGPDGHYDLDAMLEDDPSAVADGNHGL
ncbi:regulatory P domain-containing protein [Halovivax sp.]|uniref:regulatory P domain-containing protein n=1 Tax=Halovivax sp. TaxID=1935978 RepID=UPI0025C1F181|nr:regulatory P domain-containing protein [Halovivax sp.]